MKIALGTVQFGIPYGIANDSGQVKSSEVKDILKYAKKMGVDTIDTARSYGTSERNLGMVGVDSFKIVSKLPEVPDHFGNLNDWVEKQVNTSLKNLGVEVLSGLLLHRPSQLLDENKKELWPILLKLKSEGVVNKIGFSIYTPDELEILWNSFKPDLIQAPYNIFDRRLEESGWLQRMSEENVEIHVRSIFLQGLLIMNKFNRPEKFNKWSVLWDKLEEWLLKNNISPVQANVSFALSEKRISKVIVGTDNLIQFKDIIYAANNIGKFPEKFNISDERLINPSEWNLL